MPMFPNGMKALRDLLRAGVAIVAVSAAVSGVVIGLGDSIMYGYPSEVAAIDQMGFPSSVTVSNLGVPGTLASNVLANAQNGNFDSYYSTTKPSICIVQTGINDLCHGNNVPGSTLYQTNTTLVKLMQSKGFYVALCTLLPVSPGNSGVSFTAQDETERQNYNTDVRNNTAGADCIIDFAANGTIGDAANVTTNTAWYVDGIHPTQAGYNALIPQYVAAVNALIGNPIRQPSSGGGTTAPVSPTATTTTLTSSENPSVSGDSVTLTATVSPSAASGNVTFTDNGGTQLGTATLSNGVATLTTAALSVASHSIVASYSGNSSYAASSSSALTQTVSAASGGGASTPTALNTTPLAQPVGSNANWVYSNSNRTIKSGGAGTSGQRGIVLTTNAIVGKKMFFVSLDADPSIYSAVGINTGSITASSSIGFDANGVGIYDNAGVWKGGSNIVASNATISPAQGLTIGVFVDQTNNKMYFSKDGAAFYGTASTNAAGVAAGTSGIDIFSVTAIGAIYGALGERDSGGHQLTLLTAVPNGWTTPAGFSLL